MTEQGTDVSNFKRSYKTGTAFNAPDQFSLSFTKEAALRYGENPNQPAGVYVIGTQAPDVAITLELNKKGGWSATNYMDVGRALDVLKFFTLPAVAVMKHLVPSGFAVATQPHETQASLYIKARDADKRAAFGSVVVFNTPLTMQSAHAIEETYVEVVAAPDFEEGVVAYLEQGRLKNLRVVRIQGLERLPKFVGDASEHMYDTKTLPSLRRAMIQAPYLTSIVDARNLIIDPVIPPHKPIQRAPTAQELSDLLTSWYVNIGVRSNGIVIVRDGVTLAIGTGQQERVRALSMAIRLAYQKIIEQRGGINTDTGEPFDEVSDAIPLSLLKEQPLKGAVLSSDAFFPFRDSIDIAAQHGITAIIQPGGSERDAEIIAAANEHGMAMAFTLERCFGHF